jgi:hypothetical protein
MTTLFGSADLANGMPAIVRRLKLFEGPLELSWQHCAVTADFIADLSALHAQPSRTNYKEVRHSVGYLVNELVENAVKFRSPGEIVIEACTDADGFKVKISNVIDEATATRFQHLLSEITVGDPGDLLIQRIEANAADPTATGSGLGLLTLMNDYGARLAWIFRPIEEDDRVELETYASLPISVGSK